MRIEIESRTEGAKVEDNFNGAFATKMGGDGYVICADVTVKHLEVHALMGAGVMVRCPPLNGVPEAFFEVRFIGEEGDASDLYVLDASISRYTLTATLVPRGVWDEAKEVVVTAVVPSQYFMPSES